MKLKELHNKIKDLKLKGEVIIPFRKSEYTIKSIGQGHFILDVHIEIVKRDEHEHISVKRFVGIIDEAMQRASGNVHCEIEILHDEDGPFYKLAEVYFDGNFNDNLYLTIKK